MGYLSPYNIDFYTQTHLLLLQVSAVPALPPGRNSVPQIQRADGTAMSNTTDAQKRIGAREWTTHQAAANKRNSGEQPEHMRE